MSSKNNRYRQEIGMIVKLRAWGEENERGEKIKKKRENRSRGDAVHRPDGCSLCFVIRGCRCKDTS
jgi:hypothetical protein